MNIFPKFHFIWIKARKQAEHILFSSTLSHITLIQHIYDILAQITYYTFNTYMIY